MSNVTFIRKNGRVIPIRAEKGAAAGTILAKTVKAGSYSKAKSLRHNVKPNPFLKAAGMAGSIASGVISGATMFSRGRKFWAGQAASLGLDIGSPTLATLAYAKSKGSLKDKAKGAAKDSAFNEVLGYGALAGTLLATKSSRLKTLVYARKGFRLIKKGVGFAAKVVL